MIIIIYDDGYASDFSYHPFTVNLISDYFRKLNTLHRMITRGQQSSH